MTNLSIEGNLQWDASNEEHSVSVTESQITKRRSGNDIVTTFTVAFRVHGNLDSEGLRITARTEFTENSSLEEFEKQAEGIINKFFQDIHVTTYPSPF